MLRPAIFVSCLLWCLPIASLSAADENRNPGTPWPATDALGRQLPVSADVGPLKQDRCVGIFYFLWLGDRFSYGPYDVTKILAADPAALKNADSPLWGARGQYHFWGEPLLGYYNNRDPWVLRRHAHMLADAGIDTLIFDTTNAVTYRDVYRQLCEVFTQIRQEGGRTPRFCFMVNTRAGQTARQIFDDLYKPGHYRDLWFHWQGKPLMICDPAEADAEVKAFFTLRRAHWPFDLVNTHNAWHWESTYPQVYSYDDDPSIPEQVNVAVAQNLRADNGGVTNMSDGNARGRSFHDGQMDRTPGSINWGYNVQEQWDRALQLHPPFVMVTSWNEWIAGRWGNPNGPPVFVDQLDQQYSRDIEPMQGGHGDNYYLQLIANVRRYKGAPPLPPASAACTISIDGDFAQWSEVGPDFTDHVGDTLHRNHVGFGKTNHVNASGRNDLVLMRVARDEENLYFYASTHEPITTPATPHWMTLFLNTDQNAQTGWQGFDFAVNRTTSGDNTAWLEKSVDGATWQRVAEIPCRVAGNELQLAIQRSTLGLPAGRVAFDFKWADNIREPADVMDFYVSGDVAPDGRLLYRYETE